MREPMPLGRALGLLLDRHHSTESGSGVVVREEAGQSPQRVRIYWQNAFVWREEHGHSGLVSDGQQVQEWSGKGRSSPHPARRDFRSPGYFLQNVFPLRAHVLGRLGDDYYPARTRAHDTGVLVELEGTEDNRRGHLIVDEEGFIHEVSFDSGRATMRLNELTRGPLDDAQSLFAITRD